MPDDVIQELVFDLEKALGSKQIDFDYMTRALYSTDASNYQIMPVGVTFPREADDVAAIHEIANKHQVALLPRGGGSSLAGQTVNQAVVMDFSRHMRRIPDLNTEEARIQVEPGLVLDQLNRHTKKHGLMVGPDPASADRATIGGCIGNNATGAHSILYGMMADAVQRLEVILADGQRTWLDASNETLNNLRQKIAALVVAHQDEIKARFPKTWRTCAGYALNKIDPNDVNLEWLFAGAEGTLGTIVQAELKLVPRPAMRRLVLVHFDSVRASLEATPRILEINPSAIELIDRFLLDKTRRNPEFSRRLDFIDGDPTAVLAVEFYGASEKELESHISRLRELLKRIGHQGSIRLATTEKEQDNVWKIRKAGLGLLMSERHDAKPIAFIEDAAVPVENLADYVDDIDKIIHEAGATYAIYAHASAGCLHVRPLVNLKTETGLSQYRQIGESVAATVIKYGGTTSGEHSTGLARGEFNPLLFGEKLTGVFRDVKQAFDPGNLMNPGKKVDVGPMDNPRTLRYSPGYEVIELKTRFDWSADGGLSGATEMCNGSGVCRKEGAGTMCPSYMATLDEAHSTRGRANALRLAMSGQLPNGITGHDVYEVYELCLSCKACKSECPSQVDVARMKPEFLAIYHDEHGTPLAKRALGNIHRLNWLGSWFRPVTNVALSSKMGLSLLGLLGLPTERPLPTLSPKRFSKSLSQKQHQPSTLDATLVVDTYTEYNHPQLGEAFLKVANALGKKVNIMRLPGQGCCGRPALSQGLVDQVKHMATVNVSRLSQIPGQAPFLFLEPSCLSMFIDDYLVLVEPDLQQQAHQLTHQCMSVEAWLIPELEAQQPSWNPDNIPSEILLHGHCHQKALYGTADTVRLLEHLPGASITELDAGCCGVAGGFGYEHYELSLKIANQRLLPAIAARAEAVVAATGTSCRTQVSEADYEVWHPVEILARAVMDEMRK